MVIENNVLKTVSKEDIKNGHFVVSNGITEIGDNAFEGCNKLARWFLGNTN